MAIGPLKTTLGWSQYRDENSVPTSPLADDLDTVPSGPVLDISTSDILLWEKPK